MAKIISASGNMLGGYYPLCKLIQSGALKNSRKPIARKKLENLFVIVTVRRHDPHEIINKNRGISFSNFFFSLSK